MTLRADLERFLESERMPVDASPAECAAGAREVEDWLDARGFDYTELETCLEHIADACARDAARNIGANPVRAAVAAGLAGRLLAFKWGYEMATRRWTELLESTPEAGGMSTTDGLGA